MIRLFLAVLILPLSLEAQPAPKIDVSNFPAQIVEDVVVPVPSEVFSVLDKLGNPAWSQILRTKRQSPSGERAQIALLLGTVIAEGFIAVEAQNAEEVKQIGRDVLKLAKAIGVQRSVQARSNSIIEFADKNDWKMVRTELDGALQDVRNAMIELKDEQLSQLVSLGGWLRGTEALTTVIKQNYTEDSAELLHQPSLLDYFERRLDGMDPKLKKNALVVQIQKRLPEIRPHIQKQGATISPESVDTIHGITEELVKAVVQDS